MDNPESLRMFLFPGGTSGVGTSLLDDQCLSWQMDGGMSALKGDAQKRVQTLDGEAM
jgi:hypothetical protein